MVVTMVGRCSKAVFLFFIKFNEKLFIYVDCSAFGEEDIAVFALHGNCITIQNAIRSRWERNANNEKKICKCLAFLARLFGCEIEMQPFDAADVHIYMLEISNENGSIVRSQYALAKTTNSELVELDVCPPSLPNYAHLL